MVRALHTPIAKLTQGLQNIPFFDIAIHVMFLGIFHLLTTEEVRNKTWCSIYGRSQIECFNSCPRDEGTLFAVSALSVALPQCPLRYCGRHAYRRNNKTISEAGRSEEYPTQTPILLG